MMHFNEFLKFSHGLCEVNVWDKNDKSSYKVIKDSNEVGKLQSIFSIMNFSLSVSFIGELGGDLTVVASTGEGYPRVDFLFKVNIQKYAEFTE